MGGIGLNIYELAERWQMSRLQCGIERMLINEDFPIHGKHSYQVEGLKMEFESEYVMCSDRFDKIIEFDSPLMFFLIQHLVRIQLIPIENGYQERLEFDGGGIVTIEKMS